MKRIGLFFDRPGGEFQPLAVCKIKILPMNGRQEGDFSTILQNNAYRNCHECLTKTRHTGHLRTGKVRHNDYEDMGKGIWEKGRHIALLAHHVLQHRRLPPLSHAARNAVHSLRAILASAESGEPDEPFARRSESHSGSGYHMCLVEKTVEETP